MPSGQSRARPRIAPSCLRRFEKSVWTNAPNASASSGASAGTARGRSASIALVTSGGGQKQPGDSTAICSTSANACTMIVSGPYSPEPGAARRRSPTSRWIVTNCPRHAGIVAQIAITGLAAW